MRWLFVLCLGLACSSTRPTPGNGSGTGELPPVGNSCDTARQKIEQLYRTEAAATNEKPERVEEAVADNTQMVMNECVKAPDKVVACIGKVSTAGELEKHCLEPLDEEGTEGEALRK